MKKTIFLAIVMLLGFNRVQAQSWGSAAEYSTPSTDSWVISSWQAFKSDSSATVYTNYLPNIYDSVKVFFYPALATFSGQSDTSKFTGTLLGNNKMLTNGSYQAAPYDYSLGTVIDTTNAYKTGTIINYATGLITQNMDQLRIKLVGSTVATGGKLPNSKRDLITIWLIGYKSKAAINYPRSNF